MGLIENFQADTVDQLNLRETITIAPETATRSVVESMREKNLGCAVLVDADGKPTGIFTEAILRCGLAQDPQFLDAPISDHAAKVFPWVYLTDPVSTLLDAMETKNYRFVVVVDEAGKVIGLTGQKGLMEYVAEHFSEEVMVQRIGSEPYAHRREGA